MSGMDDVVFNTRERPVSVDQTNQGALVHRGILDILQWLLAPSAWGSLSTTFDTPGYAVLGGLTMTPSGNNVLVNPGALIQYSSTVVPTPGSLDSTTRIGFLRTATAVAAPSPGSDTYYLLTAQMVEVVTATESRDVLDTGTLNFVATLLPKRFERQLQFRFEAGTATNFPLPSDPDWKVIGGVFRPGGGGAVLQSHLYDMRLLYDQKVHYSSAWPGRLDRRSYAAGTFSTDSAYKFARFDADGEVAGQRVWLHSPDATRYELVPLVPETVDPSNDPTVLGTNNWYYMYLAPFAGVFPVGQHLQWEDNTAGPGVVTLGGNSSTRGVLVESSVAPARGSPYNGGSLSLPAPFTAYSPNIGECICLGAFRRCDAAGFLSAKADGSRVSLNVRDDLTVDDGEIISSAALTPPVTNIAVASNKYPLTARRWRIRLNWQSSQLTGTIRVADNTGDVADALALKVRNSCDNSTHDGFVDVEFEVSAESAGAANTPLTVAGGNAADTTVWVACGFEEALGT